MGVMFSNGALFALYYLIALSVCFQKGLETKADFLANYSIDDWAIVGCRIVLTFMLLLSIVLNIFPSLQGLFRCLNGLAAEWGGKSDLNENLLPDAEREIDEEDNASSLENKYPIIRKIGATITLLWTAAIAISVTNVADFISVASSLFSSVIAMAIPGFLVLVMKRKKKENAVLKNETLVDLLPLPTVGPAILIGATAALWYNVLMG